MALKKGNDGLTAYIDQELKKMIEEGKVDEWIAQYEKLNDETAGAEDAQ